MRTAQRGEVGFAEHFDTKDEIVGLYLDAETGTLTPTTRGLIHYGRLGAHIIPARPVGAETAGGDGSRNATSWIQASATRALTGQTPEPLRACSFQFDARQRSILLLAEVERPLTEDEEDGLRAAESELAADFIFGLQTSVHLQIRIVQSVLPIAPLAGGLAFLRG